MYKQLIPAEMIARKHKVKRRLASRATRRASRPTKPAASQPGTLDRRNGGQVRRSADKLKTGRPNRKAYAGKLKTNRPIRQPRR